MNEKIMPLLQHLEDLRKVLIKCIIAICITSIAGWIFRNDLLKILARPVTDKGLKLVYLTPLEPFYTELKLAAVAGFVIALPFILWQVWGFVLPALKSTEIKYLRIIVVVSLFQFALGTVFAYFTVFQLGISFFIDFGRGLAVPTLSMGQYLSFAVSFLLPFGLIFELPLVIIFLAKIGVVSPAFLSKKRKYAILSIVIVAAILTPGPDIMSQLLMATPVYLLYELSIFLARFFYHQEIDREKP